ncbi:hypothetical protein, partial [Escherichia coli]
GPVFHTIVSIKNDGHYFCRAGGNRPDGLNEPVTLNANKFPVVIDWLSKGLIKPEKLITHTFDFQHVADAISLFEQDQKHCCKVLLTFSE